MDTDMKMMGLLDEMMDKAEEENGVEYLVTKNINKEMTAALEKAHHFGPKDLKNPGNFWKELVNFWGLTEEDAANRYCANCCYFDNTTDALDAIKPVVPESDGYCHKYEFACMSGKVCDSWEEGAEYYED
jgi:hypothetical protein